MGFEKPIFIIFAFMIVTILFLFGLPLFTGISLISTTDSANLTSFGTSYSELLPWFGLLVTAAVLGLALDSKR